MDIIIVEQGWSNTYGFIEPQTIQKYVNTKSYLQKYLIKN